MLSTFWNEGFYEASSLSEVEDFVTPILNELSKTLAATGDFLSVNIVLTAAALTKEAYDQQMHLQSKDVRKAWLKSVIDRLEQQALPMLASSVIMGTVATFCPWALWAYAAIKGAPYVIKGLDFIFNLSKEALAGLKDNSMYKVFINGVESLRISSVLVCKSFTSKVKEAFAIGRDALSKTLDALFNVVLCVYDRVADSIDDFETQLNSAIHTYATAATEVATNVCTTVYDWRSDDAQKSKRRNHLLDVLKMYPELESHFPTSRTIKLTSTTEKDLKALEDRVEKAFAENYGPKQRVYHEVKRLEKPKPKPPIKKHKHIDLSTGRIGAIPSDSTHERLQMIWRYGSAGVKQVVYA